MASRGRSVSRGKKVNSTFWVFCEGQTEESYVKALRAKYRLPIEVKPKVVGLSISEDLIKNHIDRNNHHEKDKVFLLYDADIPEVLTKLHSILGTILLASNPCIEYWFLLHYCNQHRSLDSKKCATQLKACYSNYKKGKIKSTFFEELMDNVDDAIKRAKDTNLYSNPSSSVYILIEELNKVKAEK